MHHPTDRTAQTTSFVTPIMEHWLEWEIVMKDQYDDPSHHKRMLLPQSYISHSQQLMVKINWWNLEVSFHNHLVLFFGSITHLWCIKMLLFNLSPLGPTSYYCQYFHWLESSADIYKSQWSHFCWCWIIEPDGNAWLLI